VFNFDVTVQDSTGATSAGQVFSITVGQGICNYATFGNGQIFSSAGGPGTITVTAGANCAWTVSGVSVWITIVGATGGSGNGSVNYVVAPNNTQGYLYATLAITDAGLGFLIEETPSLPEVIPGVPQQLSFVGSMPHLAAEGGWNTTFTLVNKGATDAIARTSLFASDGTPLALPVDFPAGTFLTSSFDQSIRPSGLFVLDAAGPANIPFVEGSAQLAASGAVDGFAIFHFDPTNQEAVVPLEKRNAPSYLLVFDNTNGVLTGVAIENVSSQPAAIPVILRDDTGTRIGTGLIPLNESGHTSFVLSTQFPVTANLRGTIEFDTPLGGQISVLGIRYTPPGTLTTIPALANVGTTGGSMAHLAAGDGWETTFVLTNTDASVAQASLNFFDDNGGPLSLPLSFPQAGGGASMVASSVTRSVAAGASLWTQSSGPLGSALLTGSAQLTTSDNVSGYAIFRYNPNGQEAVVPLETRNASAYLLAFDNTNGTATGVAISAVSIQAVNVPVIIRDDTGAQIGTGSIPLAANGHTSFMLASQFPVTAGIRGTVEFDAPLDAHISVLGIRSPPALTFTTLPPLAK